MQYEYGPALRKYLEWVGATGKVGSLEQIIAFNEANSAQELPYFGQDWMISSAKIGPLTSDDYQKRLARYRRVAAQGIDEIMDKLKLDALIAPTGSPAWLIDLVNGDRWPGDEFAPSTVTSVAGYPQISVPMGMYKGLPVGLSFFGRAWSEPTLIKLAYAYEQATKHRKPPTFAATANLR
jgi:amidase